jgi:hypothetical protein
MPMAVFKGQQLLVPSYEFHLCREVVALAVREVEILGKMQAAGER